MNDDDLKQDIGAHRLIEGLRGEIIPEHWDPASGGAYTRELWAANLESAREIDEQLRIGTFGWALAQMRTSKSVRRKSWGPEDYYRYVRIDAGKVIVCDDNGPHAQTWVAAHLLLAEDWELAT